MSESLIELVHSFFESCMGEREYGMMRKRVYGGGAPSSRPLKKSKGGNDHAKLLRLQRQVALLRPEIKYIPGSDAAANVTVAAGYISFLTGISQGVNVAQRVGDTVRASSFRLRCSQDNLTLIGHVSFFLIKAIDLNGALPAISTVMSSFDPKTAQINQNVKDKYKLLARYDLASRASAAGATAGGNVRDCYSVEKSVMYNNVVTYSATTAAVASASKNHLFCIVLSSDTADTVDITLSWELGYTDA